jgi:signal transduction histidine kinase
LGGLLVGAIMDVGWVSQQTGSSDAVKEKLARATGLLRSAIELKRGLIERLRPTLLDNVGLLRLYGGT